MHAHRFRRWQVLVLFVAGALLPAPSTIAGENEPTDAQVAEAVRFRQSSGLRADADFVRSVFSQAHSIDLGTPLTEGELGEVERRNDILERADQLTAYVYNHPDELAGMWMDHQARGVIEILVAKDSETLRAEIADVIPSGATIRYTAVSSSYRVLRRVQQDVINAGPDLAGVGITVMEVGVDEPGNRVIVAVEEFTPQNVDAVQQRFGPAVQVIRHEFHDVTCTSRTNCTPWRAGIYTYSSDGCTTGFNMRILFGTTKYVTTAGHCNGTTWHHNGATIGLTTRNSILNLASPRSDSQRVLMGASGQGQPFNRLYRDNANKDSLITAYKLEVYQTIGQIVCFAGKASGYHCGYITAKGYGHNVGGKWIYSTKADFITTFGDSGSPVFYIQTAYGGVSQASCCSTLFSPIDFIEDDLDLRMCIDSSCT